MKFYFKPKNWSPNHNELPSISRIVILYFELWRHVVFYGLDQWNCMWEIQIWKCLYEVQSHFNPFFLSSFNLYLIVDVSTLFGSLYILTHTSDTIVQLRWSYTEWFPAHVQISRVDRERRNNHIYIYTQLKRWGSKVGKKATEGILLTELWLQ